MGDKKAFSCPFCNGTKLNVVQKKGTEVRFHNDIAERSYDAEVQCCECHARGPKTTVWLSWDAQHLGGRAASEVVRDQALAAWNDQRLLKECRNALCLLCGERTKEPLGVCDGCRWHDLEDGSIEN